MPVINSKKNTFNELNKVDVSKYVKKKGKFNYLSWAYAVRELKKVCPNSTWGVVKAEDGSPFMLTTCGYFVEVWVEVEGCRLSQVHPVLDNTNKPVDSPNAFQINTSLQRALAKSIALHGLGLYIFGGEDLPENSNKVENNVVEHVKKAFNVKEKDIVSTSPTTPIAFGKHQGENWEDVPKAYVEWAAKNLSNEAYKVQAKKELDRRNLGYTDEAVSDILHEQAANEDKIPF